MGLFSSKEEDEKEVITSYDPKNIYYDIYGNLRYGIVLNDIIEEMRRMILNDSLSENNMTWYIIDSAWLSLWLHFAHYDKFVSPCPGPCRNDDLITFDHITEKWIPKKNLVLATKDKPGHYCRVNREVWNLFRECYEHSGPEIKIENHQNQLDDSRGTENWIIDQSNCPEIPNEEKSKSLDFEYEYDQNENENEHFDYDDIIKTKSIKVSELSNQSKAQTNKTQTQHSNNKGNNLQNKHNNAHNRNSYPNNIPSTEFTMEDETISKDTIHDIQRFFGVNKSIQNKNKINTKEFNNKYSNLTTTKNRSHSLTEGSEVSQENIPPLSQQQKDTKEMVAVWLFGENNLLP